MVVPVLMLMLQPEVVECSDRPYQSEIRWFNQIADGITPESYIVPEGTSVYAWPMDRVAIFVSVEAPYPLEWGAPLPWGLFLVPPNTLLLEPDFTFTTTGDWAVVRTDACLE